MTNFGHRIVLASRPTGAPVAENFRYEAFELPTPRTGEVLVRNEYLSLDPYMRGRMDPGPSYAPSVNIDEVMTGGGVGIVEVSESPAFKPGDQVAGIFGWQTHAVVPARDLTSVNTGPLPPSLALGALGMPGFTAWHGLTAIGAPKAGETLVVAAATGPVGSMVGQLAKRAGLRVVGIAGGAAKCKLAIETFDFDACIDHRAYETASDLRKALAVECPDGIDIYFENVGDKVLKAVLPLMNTGGRIPVCGTIAWYGGAGEDADSLPMAWRNILVKRLRVEGFIIFDHWARLPEFHAEVMPALAVGDIAHLEDVTEGLENAPRAFMSLLSGGNTGKTIVKLG